MGRSRRDGQVPPWQTVHDQPVDTGHDDARRDSGRGGRSGELVLRPSGVPMRYRTGSQVARMPARRVVVAVVTVLGRAATHEPVSYTHLTLPTTPYV